MNKYLIVALLIGLCQFNCFSQERINDYKYIIIPLKFEFQSSDDQYQLNSLTKFLFNKYGYTALLENEDFPEDLATNRCLGLDARVKDVKGGFLMTKIQIDLVDCKNEVIASSLIGKTKEKSYKKAYNLAIREAFKTYKSFNYKYVPKSAPTNVTAVQSTSKELEIERLKKQVEALKEKTSTNPVLPIKDVQSSNGNSTDTMVKDVNPVNDSEQEILKDLLYAQPIKGGFQVVDTEPKKVMILLSCGIEDNFIVKGKDAIVYKKGTKWLYAENDGMSLKTKILNLKF